MTAAKSTSKKKILPAGSRTSSEPSRSPEATETDRGAAEYAIQARKMRTMLDILRDIGDWVPESILLGRMAAAGFKAHPRTLQREQLRLQILDFMVDRRVGEEGAAYRLTPNPRLVRILADMEALRKELKSGGSKEKLVLKVLRELRKLN